MAKIVIEVSEDAIPAAAEHLGREVERLAASRRRITKIQYPPRFAQELGIAEVGRQSRYSGHRATPLNEVPYKIVIEYEDPDT